VREGDALAVQLVRGESGENFTVGCRGADLESAVLSEICVDG
jgi:hypothetical protein